MAQKRFSREQNLHPLWLEEKFYLKLFDSVCSPASPASDSPRNPEPLALNASSTSKPNRERRCGVIEDSVVPIASQLGLTVSYCTFQMAWEVIEKKDDYKIAYHCFPTKQKVENFCLRRIQSKQ